MSREEWPTDRLPYRDGAVHVLAEQCSTCVFRPGNLMHLEAGRLQDLVSANRERDTAFACHQTLTGAQALCRGYFDAYRREVTPLRLAVALDIVREVPPPGVTDE